MKNAIFLGLVLLSANISFADEYIEWSMIKKNVNLMTKQSVEAVALTMMVYAVAVVGALSVVMAH